MEKPKLPESSSSISETSKKNYALQKEAETVLPNQAEKFLYESMLIDRRL
jgi:hypothetical protein